MPWQWTCNRGLPALRYLRAHDRHMWPGKVLIKRRQLWTVYTRRLVSSIMLVKDLAKVLAKRPVIGLTDTVTGEGLIKTVRRKTKTLQEQ